MDSKASGAAGYSTESGRHTGTTLTDAAVRGWNTPRASMAAKGGNPDRKQPRDDLEAQARGWATPNAHDAATPKTPEQIARMRASNASRTTPGSAPGVSNLNEQAATWPTPRSSPNENRTTKPAPTHGETHGRVLAGEAAGLHRPTTCTHGGTCKPTLNPEFVTWLMGFPRFWTEV